MPWKWDQSKGELTYNGSFVTNGYSGAGKGKNNPSMQQAKGIGPIPQGSWKLAHVYNSQKVGPFAIRLEPLKVTNTFNRSDFLIHGDSISNPGTASQGCIILPRKFREKMWNSEDHTLIVVE